MEQEFNTILKIKINNNTDEKSILKNVSDSDFKLKNTWDKKLVSKKFIKKLKNVEKVGKRYVVGEFVIKSGHKRALGTQNLNAVLEKIAFDNYYTCISISNKNKEKTKVLVLK